MPLFHHKSDDEKQQEAQLKALQGQHQADQAESIRSLEQGGLPVQARRRLEELSRDGGKLYTTDLSVGEFVLARHEGLRTITQVMGSCFYHIGYQGYLMRNVWMDSIEMQVLTQAFDNARNLALGRMREEAKIVGASAVIGVRFKMQEYEWGADVIECTAIGTAVHVEGAPPAPEPALSTLSGEDFWKLLQAGYGPVGIAAGNCVFYQVGWMSTAMNSIWGGGWANRELSDLTQGLHISRRIAQQHLHNSAEVLGAEGIVGVKIEPRQEDREVELGNDTTRTDIIFTFLTTGTAVAPLKHERPANHAKLSVSLAGRGTSRTRGAELMEASE